MGYSKGRSKEYTPIKMYIENQVQSLATSLTDLWAGFLLFALNFIPAVILFVLGLVVAAVLGSFVERIFGTLKLDKFLESLGLTPYFERGGVRLRGARFLGQLVNWFIVLAFLVAAADQLRLSQFSIFLRDVLNFFPRVFAAALIMLATAVVASFLKKIVTASISSARLHGAHVLGLLTWWTVIIFGLVSVLDQFGIAGILNTLVTGIIAMFALAGGLAFGLGGKDYAAHLLNKLKNETEGR